VVRVTGLSLNTGKKAVGILIAKLLFKWVSVWVKAKQQK